MIAYLQKQPEEVDAVMEAALGWLNLERFLLLVFMHGSTDWQTVWWIETVPVIFFLIIIVS